MKVQGISSFSSLVSRWMIVPVAVTRRYFAPSFLRVMIFQSEREDLVQYILWGSILIAKCSHLQTLRIGEIFVPKHGSQVLRPCGRRSDQILEEQPRIFINLIYWVPYIVEYEKADNRWHRHLNTNIPVPPLNRVPMVTNNCFYIPQTMRSCQKRVTVCVLVPHYYLLLYCMY